MLKRLFSRKTFTSPISVRIDDDNAGWTSTTGRPHDRDYSEIQAQYTDSLTAWRKNPLAWRIISITTDYVIGKDYAITSPFLVFRPARNLPGTRGLGDSSPDPFLAPYPAETISARGNILPWPSLPLHKKC